MPIFEGTERSDRLSGTVGADRIFGLNRGDRILGLEGSDTLFGDAGNDSLFGGSGEDSLDGGDGDDLLSPGGNSSYDAIEASFGSDTIDFTGAGSESDYDPYYSLFNRIEASFGGFSATIRKFYDFGAGPELESTDTLVNVNDVNARSGLIYVTGTSGNDSSSVNRARGPELRFFVGEGEDTVRGDSRTFESILISAPEVRQFGDPDYDPLRDDPDHGVDIAIVASTSSGQMTGASRSLTSIEGIARFSGIDLVIGTFRNDVFTGGRGADRFRPGEGEDGMDGRRGFDTVLYDSSRIYGTRIDLEAGEATALYLTSNGRRAWSDGLRSVEGVVASSGSDLIFGSRSGNRLDGADGDDRLDGRNGADTLIGGDDVDRLVGGGGRDRFVFDGDDGDDRIADFANGSDRIQITEGAARFSDLSISQVGRHAVVSFSETAVTLLRTNVSVLDASDFVFG